MVQRRQAHNVKEYPMSNRGAFAALLGVNNIGKSTQAQMLAERIKKEGGKVQLIKYPDYDLVPSGPMLNAYLREGNPDKLSAREFQMLQVLNRTHREPTIRAFLTIGDHVIAEDYTGTGIAWGIGTGVEKDFLYYLNLHLLKEDLAILLDGEPFLEGEEERYAHENNRVLIERVRNIHRGLATELGWIPVNANRPKEEIHEEIWQHVLPVIERE